MTLIKGGHLATDYRKKIGMTDNLVRLALGLEDVDDLIADLKQALEKV